MRQGSGAVLVVRLACWQCVVVVLAWWVLYCCACWVSTFLSATHWIVRLAVGVLERVVWALLFDVLLVLCLVLFSLFPFGVHALCGLLSLTLFWVLVLVLVSR